MKTENNLPIRKPTRLRGFDYNSNGAYFLTICTQDRLKILSRIVGGDVLDAPKPLWGFSEDTQHIELLSYGEIADKYIKQLDDFYDHVKVDSYVIMPNHIHILLLVADNGASRTVQCSMIIYR